MIIRTPMDEKGEFIKFTAVSILLTVLIVVLLELLFYQEALERRVPADHYVKQLNTISHDNYMHIKISTEDIYKVIFSSGEWNGFIYVASNEGRGEYLYKIPEYIYEHGYEKIEVAPVSGDGIYGVAQLELITNPDFNNYKDILIIDYEIKVMDITIEENDYNQLKDKRLEALKTSVLINEDGEYVPAVIELDGEEYKTDVRLKGDWTDHLVGDKWSLRVKVSKNAILGMNEFSLQRVEARSHAGEAVLHDLYRELGGVAPRYEFVDVVINGVYKGVYALEESFTKRMIENSQKREGVIIKEDESLLWHNRIFYNEINSIFPYKLPVKTFSESRTLKNNQLSLLARYATHLFNSYEEGLMPREEIFDVSVLMKYYSVLEIFSARHGDFWQNGRYYLNPITMKLEPITFDNDIPIEPLFELFFIPDKIKTAKDFVETQVQKDELVDIYYEQLYETANYLPIFLENNAKNIERYNYICSRDGSPMFNLDLIELKAEYIRSLDNYSAFYVAGHVYGAHENDEYLDQIYPKFQNELDNIASDNKLEFGILTGDVVKTASLDSYNNLLKSFDQTEKPFYIAIGNHDINDGGESFQQVIGDETYYSFVDMNSLFLILYPDKSTWDISSEQLDFIADELSKNSSVNNIFVFTHELIWKWKDDDLTECIPNSYFGKTEASNFINDVLPLFEQEEKDIFFFAGDVGAFPNGTPYVNYKFDNIHYIASGMGGGQYSDSVHGHDQYLYVKVYDSGNVIVEQVILD